MCPTNGHVTFCHHNRTPDIQDLEERCPLAGSFTGFRALLAGSAVTGALEHRGQWTGKLLTLW